MYTTAVQIIIYELANMREIQRKMTEKSQNADI